MTSDYRPLWIVLGALVLLILYAVARRRSKKKGIDKKKLPVDAELPLPEDFVPSETNPWPYMRFALRKIDRRPANEDERAIFFVAQLIGYLDNQGLDDFISATHHKEWGLEPFIAGLQRIGAPEISPLLERAELEYERHAMACDANPIPTASPEGQVRVRQYFDRMDAVGRDIRQTGVDLKQLLEAFAQRQTLSADN